MPAHSCILLVAMLAMLAAVSSRRLRFVCLQASPPPAAPPRLPSASALPPSLDDNPAAPPRPVAAAAGLCAPLATQAASAQQVKVCVPFAADASYLARCNAFFSTSVAPNAGGLTFTCEPAPSGRDCVTRIKEGLAHIGRFGGERPACGGGGGAGRGQGEADAVPILVRCLWPPYLDLSATSLCPYNLPASAHTGDDLYVAGAEQGLTVIAAEEYGNSLGASYYGVAIVKKSFCEGRTPTLANLKVGWLVDCCGCEPAWRVRACGHAGIA